MRPNAVAKNIVVSKMPKSIVATAEDGSTRTFKSIQAAAEFITEKSEPGSTNFAKYRAVLAALFKTQKSMHGYTWSKSSVIFKDDSLENIADDDCLTLGEEIDAMFSGSKIRKDVINDQKVVSVWDILRIVYPTTSRNNLSRTLANMISNYPDVKDTISYHIFPFDTRSGRTPVTSEEGFLNFLECLEGERAVSFRKKAKKVVLQYLRGDLRLAQEIVERAGETRDVFAVPSSNSSMINGQILQAPRHDSKKIAHFSGELVYVMVVSVGGKELVKIGHTDNLMRRVREHARDYEIVSMWSVVPFPKAKSLESEMKDVLLPWNTRIEVAGKVRTELYAGIGVDEVDELVLETRSRLADEMNIDLLVDPRVASLKKQILSLECEHLEVSSRIATIEERKHALKKKLDEIQRNP